MPARSIAESRFLAQNTTEPAALVSGSEKPFGLYSRTASRNGTQGIGCVAW
jgi:hypothetical protein